MSSIKARSLDHDHDFQWDDVQILDEEPSYRKRLISEMLHIKKQKNSLNLQTDTEGLHKAYLPIINKVWLSILSARLLSSLSALRSVYASGYVVSDADVSGFGVCSLAGVLRFTPVSLLHVRRIILIYSSLLMSVRFYHDCGGSNY